MEILFTIRKMVRLFSVRSIRTGLILHARGMEGQVTCQRTSPFSVLSYLRLLTCCGCCRQKEGRYGWVFKKYLIETVIEWQVLLQLRKWTHPHEIRTPDDILYDLSSIPYTREVDEALKPHSNVLQRLLTAPNSSHYKILSEVIPAKKWLQENNKDFSTSIIPHVGTLSIVEHAQVTNWFEKNIAWETDVQALWVGLLPIAHAHTLHCISDD